MSSEETCLQGFPNDDIFGVIAFALVQIKAVGLRKMRTITVEEQRMLRRGNQGDSRISLRWIPTLSLGMTYGKVALSALRLAFRLYKVCIMSVVAFAKLLDLFCCDFH